MGGIAGVDGGGKQRVSRNKLKKLIFLALCCDLGLFAKRLISPVTNIITDALRIPGGVGTSFSLMFVVIAAMLTQGKGCGTVMGAVQSVLALALGMTGSMGALAPIGYIVPGIFIDCVIALGKKLRWDETFIMVFANLLAALGAVLSADMIVFHLQGMLLALYLAVGMCTGALCGLLGHSLFRRLNNALHFQEDGEKP